MNEKCDIIVSGCYEYQPFITAKLKLTAKKSDKIIYSINSDICSKKKQKSEMETAVIKVFGFDQKCPVNETKTFCVKKLKVLEFSQALSTMFSLVNSKIDKTFVDTAITHNSGKTCFNAEMMLYSI
ncbi:hypothetical protein PVAND_016912 [Polypedilum vanderplanki]|uniref:Uncharacterized protein n=1 Tax=Polypedilum vanderplanki TaxID=319348 RepID=A0A9J6BGJ6_POLVA|nr:hypothetical protein PVAND_016912 [Polypedilum vanderplanki]